MLWSRIGALSVVPEIFEPRRRQFGIADRVLDVLMTEVSLHGARVVPRVGQREAARMTQHVRMDLEPKVSRGSCPLHHPAKPGTVTIAGKESIDMPIGTLNSVLKQAGLKK